MKNKLYLFLFFCSHSLTTFTQNLITNGGFEDYSSLPTSISQSYLAVGWNNVNLVYSGNYATPDYYNLLGSSGGYDLGQITPNSGNGQMGLMTCTCAFPDDYREYISTQLNSPLVPGQDYQLTFYLTIGTSPAATNNFGVFFSELPLAQDTFEVINITPDYVITTLIDSYMVWEQYTFSFTATTPAEYITFGNFANDSNTTYLGFGGYYFIDDIELIGFPSFTINGETSICLGDSTMLSAINDTAIGWADSLNPTLILSTDSILTVAPLVTTTYFAYSSTDTASFTVYVQTPATIDLGNDTTLCAGESLLLDISTPNANYLWQDNSLNSSFNVTEQGIYWVDVTVGNCSSSDTIVVNYNLLPTINLGVDTSLCLGEMLLLDATTNNASYLWQNNSVNSSFQVSSSGNYWVQITVNNCSSSDSITVNYNQTPTLFLENNTTICQGEVLVLDATTANATYSWQDNSNTPTIQVTQSGSYWVNVTVNHCSMTDSISVQTLNCDVNLEIPNVFSPNGDGVNDFFVPVINNGITSMKTLIVNRWGNTMYESNNLLIEWDAINVVDGTYFWFIEYTDVKGNENKINGFVQVIK